MSRKARRGSNPLPGAKISLQNPLYYEMPRGRRNGNSSNNNNTNTVERDIYNRAARKRYWLARIQELEEPDRSDILQYVEYMQEEQRSILRIVRCIQALFAFKRLGLDAGINKPFRSLTKQEIKDIVARLEAYDYSADTIVTYKTVLKHFYKVVYGNNEYYPVQVEWLKAKVNKDLRRSKEELAFGDYLTEDEIKLLIDTATSIQRKAFIAVGYETGARPEELLSIRLRDIQVDSLGCKVILRGKTVERITRVVIYFPLLRQWLDIHPFKNDPNAYLWLSEATNHKFKPLGLRGAEKMFEETMKRAGIKKGKRLYILRHSRATHLANKLTEAQMCKYFGWSLGTKVVKRYIHLAGIQVDNVLASMAGLEVKEGNDTILKVKRCRRCNELLSPNDTYCKRCGLDVNERYIEDTDANKKLLDKVNRLEELFNELVSRFSIGSISTSNRSSSSNSSNSSNSTIGGISSSRSRRRIISNSNGSSSSK